MIGNHLRKGLRWAAVLLMLFGPVAAGLFIHGQLGNPNFEVVGAPWQFWLGSVMSLVSPIVQGGILLVLLSIDERIQARGAA
jgi:hypothetical protein